MNFACTSFRDCGGGCGGGCGCTYVVVAVVRICGICCVGCGWWYVHGDGPGTCMVMVLVRAW